MTKTTKRVIALFLTVIMLVGSLPLAAFASIPNWEENNVVFEGTSFGTNGYYNVISKKDYVLVPGAAVESEIVLNNAAGTRRQVLHIIEVDPSNPDVSIVPGYYQIDKDLEDEANWSHKELTEMAKYYENNLGYNIVGGMNTDLYYSSYSPRVLVYNGKWIGNAGENVATGGVALGYTSSILYVFKDAEGNVSCDVKAFSKDDVDKYLADGTLLHAVGVSFGMVVKDGKLVNTTEKRGNDDAARSMVGVKPDGTLVLCMNDGRGANNSVGFSSYEEGEAMLALGCQWAANCDGGGSSTFLTKRVGEEDFTMRSVPCDGAQRPTAHGIFVASNVAPTGELDVVNVEADYDIFAPKTAYTFGAEAIDTHGYAMDMPADATWALSDASFGTITDGKFVSNGAKGTVEIQILSGGKVVGSKTITVADPEVFKLSATSTVVPYSTADKVRTITLPIVAMTGEANVYVDSNAVSVTLSNGLAGELDGFKFTATDDTSIAGVDVTITYGETKLIYAIEFGKGSEVIFDFEDGDKAGFMGFEEAKKWSQDNGVNNTLVGSDPLAGQFNEYLSSETFISSTTNGGEVRNGNYALAWRLDNTDAAFASWSYNVLFNTGETIVLRDVANGKKATTLGMWLYIPENAFPAAGKGLSFQSQLYTKAANGGYSCVQDHFMFTSAATGEQTNLNSATNAHIPESRWVYATIDISKYDYLCTPVATDEGNSRSPSFIRTYVKPDTADEVTFYIDDITLDYSSAVDDRVLPTITNPTYSTADTAVSLENGATVNGNNVAFSATVADNAALDLTSGKITVDGVAIEASINGNALSTKGDVTLGAGVHTVVFEVKDELGNPMKITRTFTVAGDAVVEINGHNDSGETPKAQSIYYVDINVADLANVTKLVTTLKLNNANKWETEGAVVAAGFKATFAYNEISELLTVTVERTDAPMAKALDHTLVSIPVRVWTFDRYNYVNNTYYAPADMGNKPAVNVEVDVVYGILNGKDSFAGSINVATELTTISSPYHVHDAELIALEDKAATCTEDGYTGRTYCATCQSVADFGTVIEATGHKFLGIINGYVDCGVCGDVLVLGTGVVELNGNLYYAVNNKLVKGWQDMGTYEGDDYINGGAPYTMYGYAGDDYKLYVNTTKTIGGISYQFDEDGTTMGAWTTNSIGTRYSVGPAFIKRSWVTLDGDQYYFDENSYMYSGIHSIPVNRNNKGEGYRWYNFGEDGKLVETFTQTGFIKVDDDIIFLRDGLSLYEGLIEFEGGYYYINSKFVVVTGTYTITKNNDLMPVGTYEFDENGKMVITVKDGIVYENGAYWYYKDGELYHAGLIYDETEGCYYYVRTSGKLATGSYPVYASYANGLLPAGTYEFGADGKLFIEIEEPEQPEVKNGIYYENGAYWYYKDGELYHAGLIYDETEGCYYYVRTSGKLATGSYPIYASYANGLLPAGTYEFGADGKLFIEVEEPEQPEVKNGIYYENGAYWYYKDGELYHAGLIYDETEGCYYYVRTSGKLATGSYPIYASYANGLLPAGTYEFGADGKLFVD